MRLSLDLRVYPNRTPSEPIALINTICNISVIPWAGSALDNLEARATHPPVFHIEEYRKSYNLKNIQKKFFFELLVSPVTSET